MSARYPDSETLNQVQNFCILCGIQERRKIFEFAVAAEVSALRCAKDVLRWKHCNVWPTPQYSIFCMIPGLPEQTADTIVVHCIQFFSCFFVDGLDQAAEFSIKSTRLRNMKDYKHRIPGNEKNNRPDNRPANSLTNAIWKKDIISYSSKSVLTEKERMIVMTKYV